MSSAQELLAKQLSHLQNLVNILEKEKEILQRHSPEELVTVTIKKESTLSDIHSLDEEISILPGFVQEKSDGLYKDILAEIESCLLLCKDMNAVNGSIIQQSQLSVERLKNSLLETSNRSSMTYDNKGKTTGSLKSLNLKA